MVKAELIDNTFTLLDDYQQNVAIRNQQFQETKDFNDEDDEDDDEYDNPTPAVSHRIIN